MLKPKRSLLPVDVLLNSLFKQLGISERFRIEAIRREWCDIFGEPLSMHTEPADLKDSKLTIAVDSPAWLQHIKFLQKEITDKLRQHGIKTVQFRVGRIGRGRSYHEKRLLDTKAPSDVFRELTDEDCARISRAISGIKDEELKEVIRITMVKAARRKMDHA